ncbi:MAG: M48 family metallopeptidase [Pseudomonadales bacterium]
MLKLLSRDRVSLEQVGNGLPFDVEVKRSNRKSAVIYVRDGRAEVRVPNRVPNYWIQQFLLERQDWIENRLRENQQRQADSYSLSDGAVITFLGEAVNVQHCNTNMVKLQDGVLVLPRDDLFTDTQAAFHGWLKQQACDYISPLAHQYASEVGVEDKLTQLRFKKTKSRWGHCTQAGVVQFNWLIMLAPPAAVRYLVAHEICHLVHMDHSRRFYSLVDSICSERKEAHLWLRENEHKVLALH